MYILYYFIIIYVLHCFAFCEHFPMEASSTRMLDEHPDLASIARDCLHTVCLFNAICTGKSAGDIQSDLISWWKSDGQKDLFPNAVNGQWQEDNIEADSDEEGDEEAEGDIETAAESKEKEMASKLVDVEVLNTLEKDFQDLMATVSSTGSDKVVEKNDEQLPATDDETVPEVTAKKAKTQLVEKGEVPDFVRSLEDVIEKAGFSKFKSQENDSEKERIKRMRLMFPFMQAFSAMMRVKEGILSQAAVIGTSSKSRQHNEAEHALALARAAHACNAGRQSRFALWAAFSDRVLDSASDAKGAVGKVVKLGPACQKDAAGFVRRQLLVVKVESTPGTGSNPLRFATPTSVWRVARKTGKSGRRYLPDANLPVSLLAQVQVLLLTPKESSSKPGHFHLLGSTFGTNMFYFFYFFIFFFIDFYFFNCFFLFF